MAAGIIGTGPNLLTAEKGRFTSRDACQSTVVPGNMRAADVVERERENIAGSPDRSFH